MPHEHFSTPFHLCRGLTFRESGNHWVHWICPYWPSALHAEQCITQTPCRHTNTLLLTHEYIHTPSNTYAHTRTNKRRIDRQMHLPDLGHVLQRERERERETDRQKDTHTLLIWAMSWRDGQRETDKQTDGPTDRQTHTHTHTHSNTHTEPPPDQTGRQTAWSLCGMQTDTHPHTHSDTHTDTRALTLFFVSL